MNLQKTDIIFLSILFSAGLLLAVLIYFPRTSVGTYVEIRVDGEKTAAYSLSTDRRETLHTASGENTIMIQNGTVSMAAADCPDRVCVSMRRISRSGETIVCLPHKLVLEIKNSGNEAAPLDAVTGGAP
ncbi:MAG: NusG domain II-containing protein [Eubacterium sp.]|nr:NusG domain II-containing protein [Eubacterium sp.]